MKRIWRNTIQFVLNHDLEKKIGLYKAYRSRFSSVSKIRGDTNLHIRILGFITTMIPIYHIFRTSKLIVETFQILRQELWYSYDELKVEVEVDFGELFRDCLVEMTNLHGAIEDSFAIGDRLYSRFKLQNNLRLLMGFIPVLGGMYGAYFARLILKDWRKACTITLNSIDSR